MLSMPMGTCLELCGFIGDPTHQCVPSRRHARLLTITNQSITSLCEQ